MKYLIISIIIQIKKKCLLSKVLKQLPKKTIEIIHCDMTQHQTKEYNTLIEYYKKRKDQLLKEAAEKAEKALSERLKAENKKSSNEENNKYTEIIEIIDENTKQKRAQLNEKKAKENEDSSSNIIMELRKAANHPLLRRTLYTDDRLKQMAKHIMKESSPDTVFDYVVEDMSVMNDFQIHKLCPLYKGLSGFELKDKDILDSGKFTVLTSLLEEKKEMVINFFLRLTIFLNFKSLISYIIFFLFRAIECSFLVNL